MVVDKERGEAVVDLRLPRVCVALASVMAVCRMEQRVVVLRVTYKPGPQCYMDSGGVRASLTDIRLSQRSW